MLQHPPLKTFSVPPIPRRLVSLVVALGIMTLPLMRADPALGTTMGRAAGQVLDARTHHPIAGAVVWLPGYGLRATSGHDGRFEFGQALPTERPYRRIDAVVRAPGWGTWTIHHVPLYPNDTLILHAELRRTPFDHTVLTAAERRALSSGAPASPYAYTFTCTGWPVILVPPQTIKVYLTADAMSEQYDFVFYVAHVLPNEWIPSWDADALGAGAVAAKAYGWYRALAGHAYSQGADCADITDGTSDQVFDPTWSTAATDQAVYATFGTILLKSNAIPLAQYFAGAPGDPCAPVTGQYAGRMSQWGTQTCATQKVLWPSIVTTFYTSDTERYVSNLLLDANLQSWETYAWLTLPGTASVRTSTGGYTGLGYLTVSPPAAGGNGTLYQTRQFDGTATTAYTEQAALRCGTQNKTSCSIVLRIICSPVTGSYFVNRYTVTVPNDNAWHVYTYNPPLPGITHVTAQLSFITSSTYDLTAAVLTAPYGGP